MTWRRQTYSIGRVARLNALSFEQEANRVNALPLSLAECRHEFLELSRAFDLEKDLIIIVRDLDVEMFAWGGSLGPVTGWASAIVLARHSVIVASGGGGGGGTAADIDVEVVGVMGENATMSY